VVNYNAGEQPALTARAEVLDIDGTVKWQKSAQVDSSEDSTLSPMQLEYPAGLARTHFIRLTLLRGDALVSSNFYWRGTTEEDYTGIRTLAPAHVVAQTRTTRLGTKWRLVTELRNTSAVPALMVRIKAVRSKSSDLIAPALYDDNYIALMPGERKTIYAELEDADTRGESPRIVVSGFNLAVPSVASPNPPAQVKR
jgi:hypothetical protein